MAIFDCVNEGQWAAAKLAAVSGDWIRLAAEVEFSAIQLWNHGGPVPITITSMEDLPARRMVPGDESLLPVITSASASPITTALGASRWVIDGVKVVADVNTVGLVRLGEGEGYSDPAEIPSYLTLDRMLILKSDGIPERRGVMCNAREVTIRRSSILGMDDPDARSQAISGWDTPGPVNIHDCALTASSQNVIFGGTDPSIEDMVPTGIRITGCDIWKPIEWRGVGRHIDNLIELKNARDCQICNNNLWNIWGGEGQEGMAIVLTPRNQNGTAPWCTVDGVQIINNQIWNAGGGIAISAFDPDQPSGPGRNIRIAYTLVDCNAAAWDGNGRSVQMLDGPENVVIDHCTLQSDVTYVTFAGVAAAGFEYTNNIGLARYGFISAAAPGQPTIDASTIDPVLNNNAYVYTVEQYPVAGGTDYPVASWASNLEDPSAGDFRIQGGSMWLTAGSTGGPIGTRRAVVE